MKLTGKCKKEFEKWYINDATRYQNFDQFVITSFYNLHKSMQWGVYQDFFDSVGMDIVIEFHSDLTYDFNIYFVQLLYGASTIYDTRPEARTAAIEKANEIFNQK